MKLCMRMRRKFDLVDHTYLIGSKQIQIKLC